MQIERYSRNEPTIFLWFLIPYTVLLNCLLIGVSIFTSYENFIISFLTSCVYYVIIYSVFGAVAVLVKKRFPLDAQLFKRIAVMLPVFYFMNILSVQGLFLLYEKLNWTGITADRNMQWWVAIYGCLGSTIITFINEAMAGWEKWKASVTETTRMQTAYNKSRLLSLQRQINPHFLFNCFNSLSSLINEDEERAETFLNEMTKVYRYLLKGDEERIVSLDEELKFIESYLYLAVTRFGDALKIHMDIQFEARQKMIAPLSLQIVVENIIYNNSYSKSKPLCINILANGDAIVIENSLQPKQSTQLLHSDDVLDSLVNKYRMLTTQPVVIKEHEQNRTINIPLIENVEVEA